MGWVFAVYPKMRCHFVFCGFHREGKVCRCLQVRRCAVIPVRRDREGLRTSPLGQRGCLPSQGSAESPPFLNGGPLSCLPFLNEELLLCLPFLNGEPLSCLPFRMRGYLCFLPLQLYACRMKHRHRYPAFQSLKSCRTLPICLR